MLVHLVDATGEDPVAAYRTVRGEIEAYGDGVLAAKPEIVALSKCDALDADDATAMADLLAEAIGAPVRCVSAISGTGLQDLLRGIAQHIAVDKAAEAASDPAEAVPWRP